MISLLRKIVWCIGLILLAFSAVGQINIDTIKADSAKLSSAKKKWINNIFKDLVTSVSKKPEDTIDVSNILLSKSEMSFQRYEGKVIRNIEIREFGFERTFKDTSSRISYYGTKILNALHVDTKEWVIRQNLFIRKNTPLNSYELADNERYLRTLEFIQDARIFVSPLAGNSDSVDIIVITKDLFSITGVVDVSPNYAKLRLAEANFLGMSQRIQGTFLYDGERYPNSGFEALYSKTNIGGSFVNGTIAYTNINTGRSDGTEEEKSFFVKLDRPLVSPFSHIAGGAELSLNKSVNYYAKPDSLFLCYRYNVYDLWLGYNLGTKRLLEAYNYHGKRNRMFVSARYIKTDFTKNPEQLENRFDPIYNDQRAVLGQLTYFRQDFYKTNYLYGFGTTEDVPVGYNISATGGMTRQLALIRPYLGVQARQYIVTPLGGFVDANFKLGGFRSEGKWQDVGLLANVNFFTRIFPVHKWKLREYVRISYTQLDNRVTYTPLRINNNYGLNDFNTDSVEGNKRVSLYAESVLYTDKKLLGFRFAPIIYGNASLVSYEDLPAIKSDIFTALGAGVRTRNENLIFGTIEFKVTYFPRPVHNIDNFRINVESDIRFRYRTNFVTPPDFIQLNRDDF